MITLLFWILRFLFICYVLVMLFLLTVLFVVKVYETASKVRAWLKLKTKEVKDAIYN